RSAAAQLIIACEKPLAHTPHIGEVFSSTPIKPTPATSQPHWATVPPPIRTATPDRWPQADTHVLPVPPEAAPHAAYGGSPKPRVDLRWFLLSLAVLFLAASSLIIRYLWVGEASPLEDQADQELQEPASPLADVSTTSPMPTHPSPASSGLTHARRAATRA